MEHLFFYKTSLGRLALLEDGNALTRLFFQDMPTPKDVLVAQTPLLAQAAAQLNEYFCGQRKVFTLPLAPHGTVFSQAVWQALLQIPYGETRSYGDIAKAIGHPKAARAVGSANHCNPLAIFIPCHRVIGANGRLVGYAGGLTTKERLLLLEKGSAFSALERTSK